MVTQYTVNRLMQNMAAKYFVSASLLLKYKQIQIKN